MPIANSAGCPLIAEGVWKRRLFAVGAIEASLVACYGLKLTKFRTERPLVTHGRIGSVMA